MPSLNVSRNLKALYNDNTTVDYGAHSWLLIMDPELLNRYITINANGSRLIMQPRRLGAGQLLKTFHV